MAEGVSLLSRKKTGPPTSPSTTHQWQLGLIWNLKVPYLAKLPLLSNWRKIQIFRTQRWRRWEKPSKRMWSCWETESRCCRWRNKEPLRKLMTPRPKRSRSWNSRWRMMRSLPSSCMTVRCTILLWEWHRHSIIRSDRTWLMAWETAIINLQSKKEEKSAWSSALKASRSS